MVNKTVFILEEWRGSIAEGDWVIKGVFTSETAARGWYLEDKNNRNYYSMELDEIH